MHRREFLSYLVVTAYDRGPGMALAVADDYSATSGSTIAASKTTGPATLVDARFVSGTASTLSIASSFPAISGHEVYLSVSSGTLPAGVTLDPVGKRLIYDGSAGIKDVSVGIRSTQGAPKVTFSNATGTIPVMFGIVFPKGAVSGALGTSDSGLRVATRRAWNDGSVKHAVVCGLVDAAATVTFNTAPIAGKALSNADILAAAPTAVVDLGALGRVSLASLLSRPFETWIASEKMIECHYRGAFAGSDVSAEFHVRLWADGKMWIYAGVENSNTLTAAGKQYTLNGTVTIAGALVYTYSACPFYKNTKHSFERWAGATQYSIVVHHDIKQLVMTKLVPNYGMATGITEAALASLVTTYSVNYQMGYSVAMPNTGFHNDIGLLPNWEACYLVSGDSRAYRSVVEHAKAAFSYPMLWRYNGRMLKPGDIPTSNAAGGNGSENYYAGGLIWEISHHPSMGYLGYILTGSALQADAMLGQCAAIYMGMPTNRGNGTARLCNGVQTRATAWCQRTIGQASGILPDGSAELPDLKAWMATQFKYFASISVNDPAAANSKLGYPCTISTYNKAAPLTIAPWMHNFWQASVGHISDLDPVAPADMPLLLSVRDWMYRGIVGQLGDGTGYCYTYGSISRINVSSEVVPDYQTRFASQLYQTWAQVMLGTNGAQTCGMTLLGTEAQQPINASTGYWGNLLPAISYAVDHGASGAAAAYSRLTSAANWPVVQSSTFTTTPIWGCTPRPAPATVVKPLPILIVAGNPWPAWRQGLAVRTWNNVGSNTINDLNPEYNPAINPNGRGNAPWSGPGLGSNEQVISAWSSGGWDDSTGDLWIFGGGHNNYAGNEVYSINLFADTPQFVIRRNPSGAIGNQIDLVPTLNGDDYIDGRIRSVHTFGSIVALGGNLWVFPGVSKWPSGSYTRHTYRFNGATNDWDDTSNITPGKHELGNGGSACYDPGNDCFWNIIAYGISSLPRTGTSWGYKSLWKGANAGGYFCMQHDPKRKINLIFSVDKPVPVVLDTTNASWHTLTVSGSPPPFLYGVSGLYRDDKRDLFYMWNGGADVYTLTPPAGTGYTGMWTWGLLKAAPGNTLVPVASNSIGYANTFKRFAYSTKLDCLMCINRTTETMQIFPLS